MVEPDVPFKLDGRSGVGVIFLTLAFFQILNFILSWLPLPRSVLKTDDTFRIFRWRNLIVSWSHACITGFGSLACLLIYHKEVYNDPIEFANWPCYFIACFSTGYFVYDSLDIILAGRMREKWEILIHHTAIFIAAMYCITAVHCIGYHVLSMVIEANTAFLHVRKLMQMGGVSRRHWFVHVITYVNLFSFLLFRFLPIILIFLAIPPHWHRVPLWFAVQLTTSMIVLAAINCILFYRLLQTDFIVSQRHVRHREAELCDSLDVNLGANGSNQNSALSSKTASSTCLLPVGTATSPKLLQRSNHTSATVAATNGTVLASVNGDAVIGGRGEDDKRK